MAGTVPPAAASPIDDRLLPTVSTHQSRRRIERDLVKLESDAVTKGRRRDGASTPVTRPPALLVRGGARRRATRMGYARTRRRLGRSLDDLDEHPRSSSNSRGRAVGPVRPRRPPDLGWAAALARPRPLDPPGVMTRPSLRLRYHQGTTAHVSSICPLGQGFLPVTGAPRRSRLLAGGSEFCWDPEASPPPGRHEPERWVLASPATGRRSSKCLLWRRSRDLRHRLERGGGSNRRIPRGVQPLLNTSVSPR